MLIVSQEKNGYMRSVVRHTWESISADNTYTRGRHLFPLASSPAEIIQAGILKQRNTHIDILLGDFVDSYQNLLLKIIM